jgi:hypothetical protein
MNRVRPSTSLRIALIAASVAAFTCGAARADGLGDLRSALARLAGRAPLKADVQVHDWRRTGEGKDAKETQGLATIGVEDGPRGLQPLYSHELLARADAESRVAVKDKKAPKPVAQALGQLGFAELRALASMAPVLQREIDDAVFKNESADNWAGKPARRLVFEGTVDSLAEQDRKYVREFKSVLSVWIGADGTPLASTRHLELSGRAFIVISYELHSDDQRTFAQVGDRLVALTDEEKGHAKGAGETQEYRTERSLQVLP